MEQIEAETIANIQMEESIKQFQNLKMQMEMSPQLDDKPELSNQYYLTNAAADDGNLNSIYESFS